MQIFTEQDLASELEDGFKLVALQPAFAGLLPTVGLAIFLVVRAEADPAAGYFVVLRETPQARVYLGCTADADRRPQEWLEVWVQNARPAAGADPAFGSAHTNATWDVRWRDLATALRASEGSSILATPLEQGHLPPAILNVDAGQFEPLADSANGLALSLCTDEAALAAAGLPGYAATAQRYLYAPGAEPAAGRYVALSADAPVNERTVELAEAAPAAAAPAVSLGLDGPAVIVRRFAPLSLEDFSDIAAGQAWKGLDNARHIFRVPGVYRLMEDEEAMRCGSAHLFTTAQGRSGRLAESLYLKLQIISQAFRLVRAQVKQSQLPFLNLAADSFRVRLGATGFGLPFLWTAQADLVRPGGAFALPLQNTTTRYFQGLEPVTASVYRPGFVGIASRGTANVQIRKVYDPTEEGLALEGTIRSSERFSNDESDLISVHLPLSEGTADLLGHIDFTQALTGGQAVFRTVPQKFARPVEMALQMLEGASFTQLAFETLSPLSTPFDLYSLGVVALRLLLARDGNPLPDVLDRAFSLAHEVEANADGSTSVEDRIAQIFEKDSSWYENLGYQHALRITGEQLDATIPPRLWWTTLALVLRLFPRLLSESFCRGYGDAPPLALETVFDRPSGELEALLLRWRAFLLGGWRQNQEVARVIGAISAEY